MIYSEKCKGCRADFNISYYNQLVSEFMLLSDAEKKSNPEAFDFLNKTIGSSNDESCVSCDDVFRFEKTLTRLRSLARIKMQIGILRDRYKALVGEKRFNTYLATASKDGVLSSFLCKIFIGQFFKERQVVTHFSYRVRPPMQFHFETNKSQYPITGRLPSQDFHRPGSSSEFLV